SPSPTHQDAPPRSEISGNPTTPEREANGQPKPWGHLEALRIPLGNSEELFADRSLRLQPAHWFFENHSERQLGELFNSCGLNPEQRTQLLNQVNWQVASNGCFVSPSSTFIRSLSRFSRE